MGDKVGNNSFRKSNYLRLEKTPVQKVLKIELSTAHNKLLCRLIVLFLLDAISQNLASSKKRKRQEEKGTY